MTEKAYAKINLYLDVISRRTDGFHDIESVMHTLSLCDELEFSFSPSGKTEISLKVVGNDSIPADESNLVVKAAVTYLESVGERVSIHVTLKKMIPSSAGLGGGSSDAAATLRALNKHFDNRLSDSELLSLGARLGSDVPFCLFGGTAVCRGRGELLTEATVKEKMYFVVAIGEGSVSTPKAYSLLDKRYSNFDGSVDRGGKADISSLLSDLDGGVIPSYSIYNVFEEEIAKELSEVLEIKKELLSLGATSAMMSGSGPSVFGLFETEASAENAKKKLSELGYHAFAAKSL